MSMREFEIIADRALNIAGFAIRPRDMTAKKILQMAESCAVDLREVCERADIRTDYHLPAIARATSALLQTACGHITAHAGETQSVWALALVHARTVVLAEITKLRRGQ